MEVQKIDLPGKFAGAKNIYDVLVILYGLIDNEYCPKYMQDYFEGGNAEDWTEVNGLLDELLLCEINFRVFLEELTRTLEKSNYLLSAVHILKFFDNIFQEKEEYPYLEFGNKANIKYVYQLGPLNNDQKEYCLYLAAGESLTDKSEALQKSKCRTISRKDSSDIFGYISSYRIVRIIPGRKQIIKVKEYGQDIFCRKPGADNVLRVAIIPLSKEEWFYTEYQENPTGKNYFEIKDTKRSNKAINEDYRKLFDKLIEQKVEIVIFPELAMNDKTESEICSYLIEKSLSIRDYSLKLVFMGSLWKNGSNSCVLLSGNGSVLCRNSKKNPFSVKYQGKEYFEKLSKRPTEYEILDVRRLGRVLYIVCKDGLNDIDQVSFWNEYGVNFEVISSFSPSIAFFEQQMKDMISKYLGIAIVANCCSPRVSNEAEGTVIGFINTPYMRKKSPILVEGLSSEYFMDPACSEKCIFCGCMHIFDIRPDVLQGDEERSGMKIDHTRMF